MIATSIIERPAIEAAQSKRMEQAAINLAYYQPFFGTLVMHLPRVVDWEVSTMATNGKVMFWNPSYVATLSAPEIEGVQAHEGFHCALLHFARMTDRDSLRWNYATDFEINAGLLKKAKLALPGVAVTLKSPPGDSGHLYDPAYEDMTAEQIYPLMPVPPENEGGEGGGEDGQEEGQDGKPGKGGNSSGKPGDGASGPLERSMIGTVMPGDGDAKDLATSWEIRVRQAVAQTDKQAGFVPGSIRDLINKLNNPQIDWRERLRDFTGAACAVDVSWSRPSRRHPDFILPSRPYDAVAKVLVMIDRSGSCCGPEESTAFFSECEGMLAEGAVNKIQWACVDTRVASHGEMVQGDTFERFEASGGGGTHFESAMKWAAEQSEVAAIIFLTDGATAHWGADPGIPVLWIGGREHKHWLDKAPYGEVSYIRLAP